MVTLPKNRVFWSLETAAGSLTVVTDVGDVLSVASRSPVLAGFEAFCKSVSRCVSALPGGSSFTMSRGGACGSSIWIPATSPAPRYSAGGWMPCASSAQHRRPSPRGRWRRRLGLAHGEAGRHLVVGDDVSSGSIEGERAVEARQHGLAIGPGGFLHVVGRAPRSDEALVESGCRCLTGRGPAALGCRPGAGLRPHTRSGG